MATCKCGAPLPPSTTKPRIWCSLQCRRWNGLRPRVACEWCGGRLSGHLDIRRRFCSGRCKQAAAAQKRARRAACEVSVIGYHRGHEMRYVGDAWRYTETGERVADNPEPACGLCGAETTPEGHDGCLGTLPGVRNACCGHGREPEAYVSLMDGRRIAGPEAMAWMSAYVSHPARTAQGSTCCSGRSTAAGGPSQSGL